MKLSRLFFRGKPCTVPNDADEPWQSEAYGELEYVRLSLIVLRPREPYARWVRSVEPYGYSLQQARQDDCIAFLIPMQSGAVSDSEAFLSEYWSHFFAQALEQVAHDHQSCATLPTAGCT